MSSKVRCGPTCEPGMRAERNPLFSLCEIDVSEPMPMVPVEWRVYARMPAEATWIPHTSQDPFFMLRAIHQVLEAYPFLAGAVVKVGSATDFVEPGEDLLASLRRFYAHMQSTVLPPILIELPSPDMETVALAALLDRLEHSAMPFYVALDASALLTKPHYKSLLMSIQSRVKLIILDTDPRGVSVLAGTIPLAQIKWLIRALPDTPVLLRRQTLPAAAIDAGYVRAIDASLKSVVVEFESDPHYRSLGGLAQ